jgi:catechol 2,3-dioxygenase-like lactoylglutathione lyase family enzyme
MMSTVLRLGHLNITVSDVGRSTDFYGRWFGFDRVLAEYPDGTRFVTDRSGFELGLHHESRSPAPTTDWHFGFLAEDPEVVRDLMRSLNAAGVSVLDPEDEPGYVGFKCDDPDGYVIEVYWEPRA